MSRSESFFGLLLLYLLFLARSVPMRSRVRAHTALSHPESRAVCFRLLMSHARASVCVIVYTRTNISCFAKLLRKLLCFTLLAEYVYDIHERRYIEPRFARNGSKRRLSSERHMCVARDKYTKSIRVYSCSRLNGSETLNTQRRRRRPRDPRAEIIDFRKPISL